MYCFLCMIDFFTLAEAKAMAEAQMANATKMAADQAEKCSIQ